MMKLRLPEQNNVFLTGRLTRDPELRFTPKGKAVCSFDIAVNRRYKDPTSGEWMDDTSFVPVVVWDQAAQRCGDRLKKGSPIFVQGRLKSRSWETKEGQKRTALEVVSQRVQFLESTAGSGPAGQDEEAGEPAGAAVASGSAAEAETEEVPF